jgi:hypothetical protein
VEQRGDAERGLQRGGAGEGERAGERRPSPQGARDIGGV